MALLVLLRFRWLGVPYTPRPEERPFLHRVEVQRDEEVVVRLAVLDDRESERLFGVPVARRGIQPVWLQISKQIVLDDEDQSKFPIGAQGAAAIYTTGGGWAALRRIGIRGYSWMNWLYPLPF